MSRARGIHTTSVSAQSLKAGEVDAVIEMPDQFEDDLIVGEGLVDALRNCILLGRILRGNENARAAIF